MSEWLIVLSLLCIPWGIASFLFWALTPRERGTVHYRLRGEWFFYMFPVVNIFVSGELIIELIKGELMFTNKVHKAWDNSVYFLPLFSLGLLYFV